MPYVVIRMLKGETIEKKRVLVKEVTEAVAKALEIPPQSVAMELEEFTPENMGQGAAPD
jgi:4-oxalocrotonate tautomerase